VWYHNIAKISETHFRVLEELYEYLENITGWFMKVKKTQEGGVELC